MVTVPTYDPGGTQRTQPMRPIDITPDAFGAQIGRAVTQVGQNISQVADAFKAEEAKNDDTAAMDLYTQASSRMRQAMYDPNTGLMNKQGKDAIGLTKAADETSQTIYNEVAPQAVNENQRRAFQTLWQRHNEAVLNGASEYEFKQAAAARNDTQSAALGNIQDDMVANYQNPKALETDKNNFRAMIAANPNGFPPEKVAELQREGLSSLNLAVMQRLAQDSPGAALDYYNSHKSEFNGADHAKAFSMVDQVAKIREVKGFVQQTTGDTLPAAIQKGMVTTESGGDPNALSPAGAIGQWQLMPDTAREQAKILGKSDVAAMSDRQLHDYFATKQGQIDNSQIGQAYMSAQMKRYNGDYEAALIAYNAGPANADKFLNAGRDYSVLPKSDETFNYVRKVFANTLGANLDGAKSSTDIQNAANPIKPGSSFNGDSTQFLLTKLHKDKPASYITDMQPVLRNSLASMMSSAPDFVKNGLDILSGTRTPDKQAEIISRNISRYGFSQKEWDADVASMGPVAAGDKWRARLRAAGMTKEYGMPGTSHHQLGLAADLGWNGGEYSGAPQEVKDWVQQNSTRFGLTFPVPGEDWHIEPSTARDGQVVMRDPQTTARNQISNQMGEEAGRVIYAGNLPSAADIYTSTVQPYTVQQNQTDLTDWLAQAQQKYADDPAKLAEATRQLTLEWNTQSKAIKADQNQAYADVLGRILNGDDIRNMDPSVLQKLAPGKLSALMATQDKWQNGKPSNTDTYLKLDGMSPEEFSKVDLHDYVGDLSQADTKKFADRQRQLSLASSKAHASDQIRTRTQMVNGMVDQLGLDPKPGSDDAKTVEQLNRALDDRIAAWNGDNPGKRIDSQTTQKMLDELVINGTIRGTGWISDTSKMEFQLTPEEKSNFTVATSVDQIPSDKQPIVAQVYRSLFGQNPTETPAVDLYNDLYRIQIGGTPTPPDYILPRIRQAFVKANGFAPNADQAAQMYTIMLKNATTNSTQRQIVNQTQAAVQVPVPVVAKKPVEKPATTPVEKKPAEQPQASTDWGKSIADTLETARKTILPTPAEWQQQEQARKAAQPADPTAGADENGVVSKATQGDLTVFKVILSNGVKLRRYVDKDGNTVKEVKGWE